MKKTLLVLLALLMGLFGCASIPLSKDECNATLFPTAHEHELCLKAASDYQIEQDEREDRLLIKRDKLIMFLNACDASNTLMIVEIRRIATSRSCLPSDRKRRAAMREYGYKYTHDNVCRRGRMSDFACMSPHDVKLWLERLGY